MTVCTICKTECHPGLGRWVRVVPDTTHVQDGTWVPQSYYGASLLAHEDGSRRGHSVSSPVAFGDIGKIIGVSHRKGIGVIGGLHFRVEIYGAGVVQLHCSNVRLAPEPDPCVNCGETRCHPALGLRVRIVEDTENEFPTPPKGWVPRSHYGSPLVKNGDGARGQHQLDGAQIGDEGVIVGTNHPRGIAVIAGRWFAVRFPRYDDKIGLLHCSTVRLVEENA